MTLDVDIVITYIDVKVEVTSFLQLLKIIYIWLI